MHLKVDGPSVQVGEQVTMGSEVKGDVALQRDKSLSGRDAVSGRYP